MAELLWEPLLLQAWPEDTQAWVKMLPQSTKQREPAEQRAINDWVTRCYAKNNKRYAKECWLETPCQTTPFASSAAALGLPTPWPVLHVLLEVQSRALLEHVLQQRVARYRQGLERRLRRFERQRLQTHSLAS